MPPLPFHPGRRLAGALLAALATLIPPGVTAAQTPTPPADASPRVLLKLDPPFVLLGGYGGAIGVQVDDTEVGVMGFSAPLPDGFRDMFLADAEGRTVDRNWGIELYAQRRVATLRWPVFVGGLVSYDRFKLRDRSTAKRRETDAFYVAPRIAIRIPLGHERLFFEPALGLAVRVWEKDRALQPTRPVAPLSFASVGWRW